MQTSDQPILRDIVLVGGGHSHVGVLRMFGMKPWPGVRLTLICTDIHTPYSGMLPGYIAGHYSYDDVHIDLGRLCAFAGARLFKDEVVGIDRVNQKVICKNRPPVAYDALSINIGSTPQVQLVPGALENAVPVKPIARFNQRWVNLLDRVKTHAGKTTIAVVGGGAGGVELALAMQFRLRNELSTMGRNPDELEFHLFTADAEVLPTHNPGVRARFEKVLNERGVVLHRDAEVVQLDGHTLQTKRGERLHADEIMWVTQAGGAAWLKNTDLELDSRGFINVGPTLQTTRDPKIFAAGDIANLTSTPLEKAGVFAVRMGKPLTKNLHLFVQGADLLEYRPQKTWLALISTGDKYAVASKGSLGFAGAWVWQWKDWIDRRFMAKFSDFPDMDPTAKPAGGNSTPNLALTQEESLQAISAIAMRCGGCGAKVGSTVLSRALGNLKPVDREDVLVGLHAPDDAAIVKVPPGKAMVHTVDFFRAFVDDPYIFGKVAANHALGDVFAMGGEAQSATAVVTVPPGLESKVEELLFQMMSGAVEVLNDAGCALVGGHTGEGRELALGFAINGLVDENLDGVMIKGGMRPGDAILLTKPIGTGTLFAALPQFKTKGRWIDAALESMVKSNRLGAQCLREYGSKACTDLTGFGLLGHLVEMTRPSEVDAELDLSALPLLDGALDMVSAGIVSSLQPANVRLRRAIRNQAEYVNDPRYPLIFDPQTAGGLLATVPGEKAEACVAALKQLGYEHTAIIGRILPQGEAIEPIVLKG
ncbi:MAG: selenophosphate synthase [Limnobacter sp. CACIAM 66H1]|jgi:selenide,water dikinase|uniref:selenide, water dikinase SelD n=1 Tax=Limnobacter sp. CACIAM 66H1 TaxID=1813033 RepID=UPI0007A87791|nr:selenide, water dikinase SelD [Limnobacter sp. CACIAM 66H1]KYP12720.1 MAG: selenophosphate synthase [Limnobacter sp. CACIAM 66H1]